MKSDKELLDRARGSFGRCNAKFENIQSIVTEELLQEIEKDNDQNVILVDVREPKEMEVSIIPKAISKSEFEAMAFNGKEINPSYLTKLIVPYCTIGYRSGEYTKELSVKGFQQVRNGEGIVIWAHIAPVKDSKYEVVKKLPGGKYETTNYIHVFSSKFNHLPKKYIPVEFTPFGLLAYVVKSSYSNFMKKYIYKEI